MEKNNFPNAKNIFHLIAVGFGSGLIRIAPGTWGSTLALILFIVAEACVVAAGAAAAGVAVVDAVAGTGCAALAVAVGLATGACNLLDLLT